MTKKGNIQVDYVIAFGFFFLAVVFISQLVIGYLAGTRDNSGILLLRADALELLSSADFPLQPANWTSDRNTTRIGFSTSAYRIYITVNNTHPFIKNSSQVATDIPSELIIMNFTDMGFPNIDLNSTVVYDENNNSIDYQISTTNITFALLVNAAQVRNLTVYFDDDSNFTSRSVAISVIDNITETFFPHERLEILQFRQMQRIMNSNYTLLKNATRSENDFRITVLDVDSNTNFMEFGTESPRRVNVVTLQRSLMYQNSSGFVKKGRMTVQVG